jgi:hypothetical protein
MGLNYNDQCYFKRDRHVLVGLGKPMQLKLPSNYLLPDGIEEALNGSL